MVQLKVLALLVLFVAAAAAYDVAYCKNGSCNRTIKCYVYGQKADCDRCTCVMEMQTCRGMCCFRYPRPSCDITKIHTWQCPKNKRCYNDNCARGCR